MVVSGTDPRDGSPLQFSLNENLKNALDEVKRVVGTDCQRGKDWDYISIVAGLPGTGKSNFAQNCARYCCSWFNEDYIAFTSDEFIELTNNCKENSAVILDESFQSLNSKVGLTSEFLKIINHLQLIRQKRLYIFLCLPNFFDLSKSIAIYRSMHLFSCYSPKFGERGSFAAWGREEKKQLYILGQKFMNYNAVEPNFRGTFTKAHCINEERYLEKKKQHLLSQSKSSEKHYKDTTTRDRLIVYLKEVEGWPIDKICGASGLSPKTIYNICKRSEVKQ